MDTKAFFAAMRFFLTIAVGSILLRLVLHLLMVAIHPAMGPAGLLFLLTLLFLFVMDVTKSGTKAEKMGILISRWVWQGKLRE